MFNLVQKLELDTCYQCKEKIETVDEFSIEHKTPWLDSSEPKELFYSLENIGFSHLSCNVRAARQTRISVCGTNFMYNKGCRCEKCREAVKLEKRSFRKRKRERTGKDR